MRKLFRLLPNLIVMIILTACHQSSPPPDTSEGMVLIPSGEFIMGTDSEQANSDQHPAHTVYLDAFYIDKCEVTNQQFEAFIMAGGYQEAKYWRPEGWRFVQEKQIYQPIDLNRDNFNNPIQPVVGINWYEADAYARWAGKRLPTEAEWEKAARGTDARIYPWGNEMDFSRLAYQCNNVIRTMSVGSFPKGISPFGVYDMAGNVWEWVSDWYGEKYYSQSKQKNRTGPSHGKERVVRGGGWGSNRVQIQCFYRYSEAPTYRCFWIGFRCAKDAE